MQRASHRVANMALAGIRFIVTAGIATAAALNGATAQPSDKTKGASDATALSSGFWTEFKDAKNRDDVAALQKVMGTTDNVNAAIAEGRRARGQSIAKIAVDRPADVAKMLDVIAASPGGATNKTALETVLKMRTTAKARADDHDVRPGHGGLLYLSVRRGRTG
mgnify:CR=1 FL=1